MSLRIVGLDVSSTSTGVAMADGRVTTVKPKADTVPKRLVILLEDTLNAIRAGGGVDIAVIEGYNPGGIQGFTMARLGEAGGVIRWALERAGIHIVEVTPSQLKKFGTGKGNAPKEVVWDAAVAAAPNHGVPQNDDEGDAFWLRQIGLAKFDPYHDDAVPRNEVQWAALTLIRWPKMAEHVEVTR